MKMKIMMAHGFVDDDLDDQDHDYDQDDNE